ncbi:acyltransferase domain-containing protein [Lachnospiraceae bacterium 54-53]
MSNSIVFLCLGQGSQYFNMTYELYRKNKAYHDYLCEVDDLVYQIAGCRVLDYIFDKSKSLSEPCDDLQLSSLALFLCQYSLGKLLIDQGIVPDYIVGSSMGELVALALSNDSHLERVIKLLSQSVRRIEISCQKGGMLAVLHNSNVFYKQREVFGDCEIAGINCDDNFVVTGSNYSLMKAAGYLKENRIIFQRLPVQYAFHSDMIAEVHEEVESCFRPWKLNVPIGSCAYGDIIEILPRSYIWDILRRPILFQEIIQRIEKNIKPIYFDLSPGGTLSNFIRRIGTSNKIYSVINRYHKENEYLERLINAFTIKER